MDDSIPPKIGSRLGHRRGAAAAGAVADAPGWPWLDLFAPGRPDRAL